jgi:uncharacterized protein YegP (UPF0339 family)
MSTLYFYIAAAGEYRWRIRSRNGRTLADSGEGYKKLGSCLSTAVQVLDIQFEIGDSITLPDSSRYGRFFKLKWQIGNQFNAPAPKPKKKK